MEDSTGDEVATGLQGLLVMNLGAGLGAKAVGEARGPRVRCLVELWLVGA